ncbi:hypothetical protein RhiirA5_494389 [Rhizophagus irregularis]|uniref:Actin-like ATPase domain-containing protein n=1 Tax=Rhizophagus irregularis TaxID=588596 RepID=A0A2N0Q9D3_9GLOM|nr:hypothetical protein RhiirA5_494389 [Rhizophagus irregularis]CAB5125215.1 unnamed protein product [Rhizophagus irregularis]
MSSENDVNVVVAIDFGTTFSGFAFANKVKPEEINISNIHLNNIWLGRKGLPKTNTALLYIDEYLELNRRWGEQALIYEPSRRVEQVHYIIERFKLLLDNDAKDNWPVLPKSLDAKTVITDYFVKMKEVIEEVLEKRCRVSLSQVLFVLSVPAEWPPHTRDILRDCVYKAGLLDESKRQSNNYRLEFTTEPEAAAIYCLSYAGEDFSPGDTYLVVDCGGGTVDLTIRTLLPDKTLEEETVRSGGLCGSTFVDQEFLKFLRLTVGSEAMDQFKKNHYGSLQKLIYKFFCPEVKLPFDGESNEYEPIELDLEKYCPALIQYITGETKERLENEEWIIDIKFDDVMRMFDPAVNDIIDLIHAQLERLPKQRKLKTMFLVGGFSESTYLFKRVKSVFKNRIDDDKIINPPDPIAAIVKGACYYGLNKNIVKIRILKWSYGIETNSEYNQYDDPKELRFDGNRILRFNVLANQGDKLEVNKDGKPREYKPLSRNQLAVTFKLLYANFPNPKYPSQKGVKTLGKLTINLPLKGYGTDRIIEFFLRFAEEELKVTARNKITLESYSATFNYPRDGDNPV